MNHKDILHFYSSRLENMADLAMILDQGGHILYANSAARLVLDTPGTNPDEPDIASQLHSRVTAPSGLIPGGTPSPVSEIRLRINLPDRSGTRHVTWKCVEIPALESPLLLAWGTCRGSGSGPEMGFTISPGGIIQAASTALCQLCGYTRDELVGKPARHFYFTSSSRKRIVTQLKERREVENGEVTLRHKDGSPIMLGYSAESVRDENGRILAYSGYFQERFFPFSSKLARDFSRIVDALPGVAWVSGRNLRIVAANEAYLKAYGLLAHDVVGKTEYEFLPPELARFPIEAALKVFEEKQELLHSAVPHLMNHKTWHRVIRRPIFDDDRREVIGLLGIAQDISAKVMQENAFMEHLRGCDNDAVVVTDDQGRILRRSTQTLNPTIYGRPGLYDAYTLDMRPVLDLLHVDDLPAVRQAMHRALREHREQHLQCRIRNQAGSYSTILARLVFNDSIYGEPRMYIVARDISGLVEMRTASLTIERLKEASGSRTDRDLAEFLNVSPASISNARKNDRIPADWLIDAGLRAGRSIDWLVSGSL